MNKITDYRDLIGTQQLSDWAWVKKLNIETIENEMDAAKAMFKEKYEPKAPAFAKYPLGSYVEDMSGIIGQITGLGQYVGTVRVKFDKDCYRDLNPEKLKPARYTTDQVKVLEMHAIEMYESLKSLRGIEVWIADSKMRGLFQIKVNSLLTRIDAIQGR